MYIQASDIQDMYIQVAAFNMYTQEAGHDRIYIQNKRRLAFFENLTDNGALFFETKLITKMILYAPA